MKRRHFGFGLAALAAGCADPRSHSQAVYMLVTPRAPTPRR